MPSPRGLRGHRATVASLTAASVIVGHARTIRATLNQPATPHEAVAPGGTLRVGGGSPMTGVTHVERGVLRILVQAGGRQTFRPDGFDRLGYVAFDRDVVRTLYSLRSKDLVSIDEKASRVINMPGQEGKFAAIVADVTQAGREALA